MDDYAGRVLADRYRLPLPPSDEYELVETRAFDTYSGQEVLIRQLPLPEVVDAEVLDTEGATGTAGTYGSFGASGRTSTAAAPRRAAAGRTTRRPSDPAVRRAIEAAQAAAQIPDHPRLDQVFDVFAEAGSLWIVSELVAARPLAALLAERPLNPYRAAEIGSDVLTALRALHAHGWVHRNITARTVLVCDDGRVVLTGLAAGAAEEALCGYVPVPQPDDETERAEADPGAGPDIDPETDSNGYGDPNDHGDPGTDSGRVPALGAGPALPYGTRPYGTDSSGPYGVDQHGSDRYASDAEAASDAYGADPGRSSAVDVRSPRSGAIAAYRAGVRAAARADEAGAAAALPPGGTLPAGYEQNPWPRPGIQPPAQPAYDGGYDDDTEDEDDDGGHGGEAPRALLTGTWHDGPDHGPVPAGGTPGRGSGHGAGSGSGVDRRPVPAFPAALKADAQRHARVPGQTREPATGRGSGPGPGTGSDPGSGGESGHGAGSGSWDEVVAAGRPAAPYRGPATPLAAERARQTRIAVVGAVTERWAPEQAGPVHGNWQLAPPITPATDLWGLGTLLYRAVQGHAPYPEESAAELVQMVCAEPPAFAEECGPLRPVVESLLRQDPTERPDFEELRGWLRSLIRSAPEPDAGTAVVPMPSVVDDTRLPIVRRRGELVRKRRGGAAVQGRHRHKKPKPARGPRAAREHTGVPREHPRAPAAGRAPKSLGRTLLIVILLALAAAVAYAVLFMPKAGTEDRRPSGHGAPQPPATAPGTTGPTAPSRPTASATGPASQAPSPNADTPTAPALAAGYVLKEDPEGFRIGVDATWRRSPINDVGQVRYTGGDYTLVVVPGRDTVQANGSDPLEYQRSKERELQPWRDSSWASVTGMRRVDVGQQVMAEGQFTWQDTNGREVYVRNLALVVDGRYHVIQVIGPDGQRDKVTEIYEQAVTAYRVTR
ncbi:protein kinase [Streptomyces sp. NPDC013953]|uniref:protein kinase n=1 Tax=Streptomyces sp. NPDC013953 TaxID=3364868 RepID=UPI0036FB9682